MNDVRIERASDERQIAHGGPAVRTQPGDGAGRASWVNSDHKHNSLLSRARVATK